MKQESKDPYRFCHRENCEHDLVQGVLIRELLGTDGPYQSAVGPPTSQEQPRELEAA